jgi:uncharacterized protein YndB with AHSA1/START domain
MRLNDSTDIQVPRQQVFASLTDIDHFQRLGVRYGVTLRQVEGRTVQAGAEWLAEFPFRGQMRHLTCRIDAIDAPRDLILSGKSGGYEFGAAISLTANAVKNSVSSKPKTLAARILLQTMKLARSRLRSRFAMRLAAFGAAIEARDPQTPGGA